MDTLTGNKLIAEFIGLRVDAHPDGSDSWFVDKNIKSIYHNEPVQYARFESSWDWLMPVVEKICGTVLKSKAAYNSDQYPRIEIVPSGYVKIDNLRDTPIFTNVSIEGSLIAATHKAVVEFIQWHNTQKSILNFS